MNRNELEQRKAALSRTLLGKLGEIPAGGPLDLVEKERREYRTHTEVKISYGGDPGERIPAYLLIPRRTGVERFPAIYAAHQCGFACDLGKEQVVGKCVDWPDQAYGLELVREGFVVLAPDGNKAGERFDPALREQWQTAEDLGGQHACCCSPGGMAWGKTKGFYDVRRGIDLLCQLPNVDPERIGIIGHSMGGGMAKLAMAIEPRIRAGVISGATGVGSESWLLANGKEEWNTLGLFYSDFLCLIAPRPFFVAVGNEDYLNVCTEDKKGLSSAERMRENYDFHRKGQEVYRICGGEPEDLQLFEFDGGHVFPSEARKASYAFLKRQLS